MDVACWPTCSANCTPLREGSPWWARTALPRGGRCKNFMPRAPPLLASSLLQQAGAQVGSKW